MSVLSLIFRTVGAWGAGIGHRLSAAQVDTNFYNIKLAIEDLFANRPLPISISSMERNGLELVVTLDNGTVFRLPWPVLQFRYRGPWAPFTVYLAGDVFVEPGVGLFSVLVDHTAPGIFDRNLTLAGSAVLNMLMASDSGSATTSAIYDIGGCYQGLIKDSPEDVLWELPITRGLAIPASDGTSTLNRAHLREAPATVVQIFPIFQNDTQVGTATFAVGSNDGVIVIHTDIALVAGDILGIGKPVDEDGVAMLFSLLLAATRT